MHEMRLDRNKNPDGRGKYAIINLRTDTIQWRGGKDDFFVLKLKDRFAGPALQAYADAVENYVKEYCEPCKPSESAGWLEYAADVRALAEQAENHPSKKTPD